MFNFDKYLQCKKFYNFNESIFLALKKSKRKVKQHKNTIVNCEILFRLEDRKQIK